MPFMRSESCSFIWQPNVVTWNDFIAARRVSMRFRGEGANFGIECDEGGPPRVARSGVTSVGGGLRRAASYGAACWFGSEPEAAGLLSARRVRRARAGGRGAAGRRRSGRL